MNDHDAPPIELPASGLALVLDKIQLAGVIARRSYSEPDKWDRTAYGAVLYRLAWNHVRDALLEAGGVVWYEENSLRFDLGGFTCSLYAGGYGVHWDIDSYDFTRTPRRAATSNSDPNQGILFDPMPLTQDLDVDPETLRSLTFVYSSDVMLGVAAIYLGAPIQVNGSHRWAWRRRLYRVDAADPRLVASAGPDFSPYAIQPEPELEIRRQVDEEEALDDGTN